MKSFETYAQTKIATGLAIALGAFGVAGCGGNDNEKVEGQIQAINQTTLPQADSAPTPAESPIKVSAEYFNDGTRLISYDQPGEEHNEYADVYEFCDGIDLVEQTEYFSRSGNSANRSVGHPACADGKLTPSDFAPLASEK